ncbi:MAG TPA: lipocalin-like domain-containing protein [Geminicoccaceae bacterium]|nr:lipocalin-like domain-containing protein [Geminicoccaceae bacterium]
MEDLAMLLARPAPPAIERRLVGTWRLESFLLEDARTRERRPVLGEHPEGYLVFTPEGRVISVITAEGRPVPKSDADRADAFRSMLAYAGRWRVDGDRFVAEVEVAWDETLVGTEQVRFFTIDGDRLSIETAPQLTVAGAGGDARGIVTWQRAR